MSFDANNFLLDENDERPPSLWSVVSLPTVCAHSEADII